MQTADFDYELPPELIAQAPLEPRDASRLMLLDRTSGAIEHARFSDLGRYLRPGDLLILNDTRVLPARLFARKAGTGGKAELLLLKRLQPLTWEALVGGRGLQAGSVLEVDGAPGLEAVVEQVLDGPRRVVRFSRPITPLLEQVGHVPLPPTSTRSWPTRAAIRPYTHSSLGRRPRPPRACTLPRRCSRSCARPGRKLKCSPCTSA